MLTNGYKRIQNKLVINYTCFLTLKMTSAQIVKTFSNVNNDGPSEGYFHSHNHTEPDQEWVQKINF